MSLPVVIASLAQEFGWPHDYWRRMGWREFNAWIKSLHNLRVAEAEVIEEQQQEAERQAAAADAIARMRGGR